MSIPDIKTKIERFLGQDVKIIYTAKVLGIGEHYDTEAYLVESATGKRFALTTKEGLLCPLTSMALDKLIKDHKEALAGLQSIVAMKAEPKHSEYPKKIPRKTWVRTWVQYET